METCIVCLGDLRTEAPADAKRSDVKSIENDDEAIAHMLPCKHDLHHSCLKPWIERANSCPTCRTTFNMVELCEHLGGPAINSFAVQDKAQEAEIDPGMIVEDELFSTDMLEPCTVCGSDDDGLERMFCDGCEEAIHVFCAGFDETPEVWYCQGCLRHFETPLGGRGQRQGRAPLNQRRGRRNDVTNWARLWQEVSHTWDLDLDFPFDDEPAVEQRTEGQRREIARWQRRFEVANQQGATSRLRTIANSRLRRAPRPLVAEPESQDELRAWNAFDKARESLDAPPEVRRRKRKATQSPASPAEPEPSAGPPQKRPRLRRPPAAIPQPPPAESSHTAAQQGAQGSTFLSSLLHEVENRPGAASTPDASDQHSGPLSPCDSSPEISQSTSRIASPRDGSASPPPSRRPLSPPLSATIVPLSSPLEATFSPFSPTDALKDSAHPNDTRKRGRQYSGPNSPSASDEHSLPGRATSTSPSRGLSFSAKEEVQRMVKAALKPHYKAKQINKDQYTEINQNVSRKMYDMVGSASALSDQLERERFQSVADEEVREAVLASE